MCGRCGDDALRGWWWGVEGGAVGPEWVSVGVGGSGGGSQWVAGGSIGGSQWVAGGSGGGSQWVPVGGLLREMFLEINETCYVRLGSEMYI